MIDDRFALDDDNCYRAAQSRDERFDGWFVTAVRTTGIYCRPSCPALTPRRTNVEFYRTAAAAQQRGFRACKRCRPDIAPGSPEWRSRDDLVGRAMQLIGDGTVDRDGVSGLARRLGYSERHLTRLLTETVGAGPIALARAQRAQTARVLIDTTDLTMTDIAFAAGFGSVRQFNDTVRAIYAASPTELREHRSSRDAVEPGAVTVRLATRPPFDAAGVFAFLALRAIPGVEAAGTNWYQRTLALPYASGTVHVMAPEGEARGLVATIRLADVRDLAPAVHRVRRLFDLDADPATIDGHLGSDPVLGEVVRSAPGLRSPGAVDVGEMLIRAIVGQQVSVAGARTTLGRIASACGTRIESPTVTLMFPTMDQLAVAPDEALPMPRQRAAAVRSVAHGIIEGQVDLDVGRDRKSVRETLLAQPGIGPWTADYVIMRGYGDPDVFLPSDLGVRHAMSRLGELGKAPVDPSDAGRWSPWRSYALHHLWRLLGATPSATAPSPVKAATNV